MKLSPGAYDVSVGSVEISNKPVEVFTDVEIRSGETAERAVEFKSGVLTVGASSEGKLVDATISIKDTNTGEPVTGGRTYTDPGSNPNEYVLSPGTYKVTVKPVKLINASPEEFETTIDEGETVELNADFGTSNE
jgi:hypothetical protein